MPSKFTVGKAVSEEQHAAFEKVMEQIGLSKSEAVDAALKAFCESHGVPWPPTKPHGGRRVSSKKKKSVNSPSFRLTQD